MKEKSQFYARLKKSYFFVIGFTLSVLVITLSIIAPFITVHDPEVPNLDDVFKPPQYFSKGWSGYVLGTDNIGRDILARVLFGSRYSFFISATVVILGLFIGIIIGLYAGYYGGWIDNLFMRFADTQLSIPYLLLAVAIVAVLGPGINNLIIVLVITNWPRIARLVRSHVLIIRETEFISASRVLGASDNWIIFSQILPNISSPILVIATQIFGENILMEAALTFFGLGIQPPIPSWGIMIADGKDYLILAPWLIMAPGIALMITILAFNFMGDGLRDALDPKMKI